MLKTLAGFSQDLVLFYINTNIAHYFDWKYILVEEHTLIKQQKFVCAKYKNGNNYTKN